MNYFEQVKNMNIEEMAEELRTIILWADHEVQMIVKGQDTKQDDSLVMRMLKFPGKTEDKFKKTKQCSSCKKETSEYAKTPYNRSTKFVMCSKCFDKLLKSSIDTVNLY